MGRAMTIYENEDDNGTNDSYESRLNGSSCKEIACCNIRPFKIIWTDDVAISPTNNDDTVSGRGRKLVALDKDIDAFTPEEFRLLFGYNPDPEVDFGEI